MSKIRRTPLDFSAAAGTPQTRYTSYGRKVNAVGIIFIPETGITADATNYATITVSDGTTTIWSWSTLTSAQGTLTAGEPAGVSPDASLTTARAFETAAGADRHR